MGGASCSKSGGEAPSYGDPIGVRFEVSSGVEFEVAIAAIQGKDLTPSVPRLAGPLQSATRACLTGLKDDETLRVSLRVDHGTVVPSTQAPSEPRAVCVATTLEGKELLSKDDSTPLLAEFRPRLAKGGAP
jgi:hypothetical protein